jgi:hypothetical protein
MVPARAPSFAVLAVASQRASRRAKPGFGGGRLAFSIDVVARA